MFGSLHTYRTLLNPHDVQWILYCYPHVKVSNQTLTEGKKFTQGHIVSGRARILTYLPNLKM